MGVGLEALIFGVRGAHGRHAARVPVRSGQIFHQMGHQFVLELVIRNQAGTFPGALPPQHLAPS
jgi:hypothetical protein